ncbi:hypothetical protein HT594_00001 [Phenacoccus solenopsis nudivirus]|nr:hypothetical protein HT594_00001 [Phenacoccus solenopsis nudivirus]
MKMRNDETMNMGHAKMRENLQVSKMSTLTLKRVQR